MEDKKQFERLVPLLSEEGLNKLHNIHVAVFGIGGVGGYIAESLARFRHWSYYFN